MRYFKFEFSSGIYIKTIKDYFCKFTMIDISMPKSTYHIFTKYTAKKMIYRYIALMRKEHTERYYKNRNKNIHTRQWKIPHHPYQTTVHPFRAPCSTFPIFRHLLSFQYNHRTDLNF